NTWAGAGITALGRACAQGGIVILGVWLVCRLFPRLPASLLCTLWWLACLKLMAALLWVAPLSLTLLPAPPPSAAVAALPDYSDPTPGDDPGLQPGSNPAASPLPRHPGDSAAMPSPRPPLPVFASSSLEVAPATIEHPRLAITVVLGALWLVG